MPKPLKRPKQGKRKNGKRSRIVDPAAIEQARRPYCVYCGKTGSQRGVHHIIFRSQPGGDDIDENLICLCEAPGSNLCHEKAHNRIRGEFISKEQLREAKEADEARLERVSEILN